MKPSVDNIIVLAAETKLAAADNSCENMFQSDAIISTNSLALSI